MDVGSAFSFREILKRKRKYLRFRHKGKYRIIPLRAAYPFSAEKKLRTIIEGIALKFSKQYNAWFFNHVEIWKERQRRYDSWDSEMEFFLRELEQEMELYFTSSTEFNVNVSRQVERVSLFIYELNRKEFGRQVEQVLKEVYYGSDMWWEDIKTQWIAEFKVRTKNLATSFITHNRDIVLKATQEGWSFTKLEEHMRLLNESFTKARVNFIARDLVGSLNGILEQNLQQSIGIDYYLWFTMADERVRGKPGGKYPNAVPSHYAMDGKICDWRNPSIYSKNGKEWFPRTALMPQQHPGRDWACRCTASPYMNALVDEVDKSIEQEESTNA